MSSSIYETWAKQLGPGFNGPKNQALWGGMAAVIGDRTLDDAQAMVEESLPSRASAAANGLTANDRGLVKGPSETDASFAARLVAFMDQWRLASTPVGLLLQLYYTGFSGAVLVQQNGLAHQISATPDLSQLAAWVTAWKAQEVVDFPSWYAVTTLPNANPPLPASTDGKPAVTALTVPWWMFDAGMDGAGNQWCGRFGLLFPFGTSPGLGTAATLARARSIVASWRNARAKFQGFWVCSAGKLVGWPIRDVDDASDVGPSTVTFYAAE